MPRWNLILLLIYTTMPLLLKARSCVKNEFKRQLGNGRRQYQEPYTTKMVQTESPAKQRKKCCPYDFDSTLCHTINDRILCGYNRNIGRPHEGDAPKELTGGCRLIRGRYECGYRHGPFTNMRRPKMDDSSPEADIIEEIPNTHKPVTVTRNRKECIEIDYRIVCKDS